MQIGFFTVFRRDPQHFLHACLLTSECHRVMPAVAITQLTDLDTPAVPGVDHVRRLPPGPMLERRLEHYASCPAGEDWLLLDTDISVRADVSDVFPPTPFDLALADRHWPHLPQGDQMLLTMPFNTGVCFTRNSQFWADVLATWRSYPASKRDWLSEQRAVYSVVRSGNYLVRILPGMIYNYPPKDDKDDCTDAKLVHYKGPRKAWLTDRYYQALRAAPTTLASVPVQAPATAQASLVSV